MCSREQGQGTTGGTTSVERVVRVGVVAVTRDGGQNGTTRDRRRRKHLGWRWIVSGDDLNASIGGHDTGATPRGSLTLFERSG